MSGLELKLFGGFALLGEDGRELAVPSSKERALVAYLALHPGKRFPRGRLAGLLWGEKSEEEARHSLSQALFSLCKRLGPAQTVIERTRREVSLGANALDVDVALFRREATSRDRAVLRRAIEMYDGDLLPGIELGEPAFDDWLLGLRSECHDLLMRAGADYLATDADAESAADRITLALRLLRFDDCAETVHQSLIRLYLDSGQHGAALDQFESCRAILHTELGIAPGPETHRLIQRVAGALPEGEDPPPNPPESGQGGENPSLVVLPITNLAGDPALTYLVNGLTDDITTELTRYRSLFVISRDSAFASHVGEEENAVVCRRFGVRHALRGTLRRIGHGFRINLRLIDGESGHNVWGERYEVSAEELMALPLDVVGKVAGRIAAWLEHDVLARARHKVAGDWSAYEHLLHGLNHHHKTWYGVNNIARAIGHFERAIELDPQCARAYAYLACAKSGPWHRDHKRERLDPCVAFARKAVELDPSEAEAHRILGGVYLVGGEHDLSRHHFERACEANPGNSHVLAHFARYQMHDGAPHDAIGFLSRARQLNPLHPAWYWENLGIAHFVKGDYEPALDAFSRIQRHAFYDQLYAAAASAFLGRPRRAAAYLGDVLAKRPSLRLSNVAYLFPYRRGEDLAHILEGLGKAGLPA